MVESVTYRRFSQQDKVRELLKDANLASEQLYPSLFVVHRRGPDSGEPVPTMCYGIKQIVARGRDGSWQEVK